jgi:hypothetical protein
VFKAAVGFLNEGAQDTRTYGKRIIWNLCQILGGPGPEFEKLIAAVEPASSVKKVRAVFEAGTAATPTPRAGTAASRGSAGGSVRASLVATPRLTSVSHASTAEIPPARSGSVSSRALPSPTARPVIVAMPRATSTGTPINNFSSEAQETLGKVGMGQQQQHEQHEQQ